LKESTEDVIIFLERLKNFDSRFSVWYKQGYSRKEAMKNKVVLDYELMKNWLCKKCNDNDYPESFFLAGLWSGGETGYSSYSIFISIGGSHKVGKNSFTLSFPYEGELNEHYAIKENWEELLELFIDHWQPEKHSNFNVELLEM